MRAEPGFAPAKINLALHVVGRRADGFHLIDSLVAFAAVGDRVTARAAQDWSLRVTGPRADEVPCDESNLVLRAARHAGGAPAALTLEKRLPVAGGLGGGSSDAAAALRALAALDGRVPGDGLDRLGADIPVCVAARTARMRGIGEVVEPAPDLPPVHVVLANPGVPLSTPAVYAALVARQNPPLPDLVPWPDAPALARWLEATRNDLEEPARRLAPPVGACLEALAGTEGCLLSRVSGSGASCFGLYAEAAEARAAADRLVHDHAGWWAEAAALL